VADPEPPEPKEAGKLPQNWLLELARQQGVS
jgi:hypothetical protein